MAEAHLRVLEKQAARKTCTLEMCERPGVNWHDAALSAASAGNTGCGSSEQPQAPSPSQPTSQHSIPGAQLHLTNSHELYSTAGQWTLSTQFYSTVFFQT